MTRYGPIYFYFEDQRETVVYQAICGQTRVTLSF